MAACVVILQVKIRGVEVEKAKKTRDAEHLRVPHRRDALRRLAYYRHEHQP